MSAKLNIRSLTILSVLVLPLTLSGCGLFSKQASLPIDPPQIEVSDVVQQTAAKKELTGEEEKITVYLEDTRGYLAPITLPIALEEGTESAKRALELMVDAGEFSEQLPSGFRAIIPQGTEILSLELDTEHQLATVNFSESFAQYAMADERKILEAVTWTLTSLPGIQAVRLQLEGEALDEMPADGYPLDVALTRDIGINLEKAPDVSITRSTPVTLYFSALSLDHESYYVPVTRLIDRTDDVAMSAVNELIAGPLNNQALTGVIWPGVAINELNENAGLITIDLQDEAHISGEALPAEMLGALVLSLTENTSAAAVKITVNGEADVTDEHKMSYSEPVSRPFHVNALEF